MEFQDLPSLPSGLPTLPDFNDDTPAPAVERKPKPFVKPPKIEAKAPEAEPFGFITNLPKSTLGIAKNLFVDLPVQVGTTLYHYAQNPEQYAKDFHLMVGGNSGLGETLWHETSDYYTKNFWHNFNEDPARALTDVAAALSAVGSLGKVGVLGRAARVAETANALGKGGLLSDAAKTAANAGRTLQTIGNVSEYLDPIHLAFKGAGKLSKPILEGLGVAGENLPDLERIARNASAREALAAAGEQQKLLYLGLNPQEVEKLRSMIMLGDPEEISQELATGSKVAKKYKQWDARVTETEQPFWNKEQHLLNDDDMIRANAKAVNHYTRTHHELEIPVDVAEDLIRNGHLKPTYMAMYRLKNQSLDLADALEALASGGKSLGRLEKRVGRGEYITDLDEIMARQIQSFHHAKYKLNLLDEVKQMLLEKKQLLIARTPEEAASAFEQGYRRLDDEFSRRYWNSYNRATQMQVEALKAAAATGTNSVEELAKAAEKFKQLESIGKDANLLDKGDIYAPRHVVAWLNRELKPISPGWKMYDKWMGRFKSAATVFNPRFWSSVIFGNALLGTFYGVSPDMLRIALKYKGDLPPALKQIAQHEIFLRDLNIYDRVSSRLGEAASRLDNIYKNAIFGSELTKDSYVRSKLALTNFYVTQAEVMKAVQHFGTSPEALAQTRLGVAQAMREMAVQLELRDKQMIRLRRIEKLTEGTIARLITKNQIDFAELSAGLDARKDVIAKAFSAIKADGISPFEAKKLVDFHKARRAAFDAKANEYNAILETLRRQSSDVLENIAKSKSAAMPYTVEGRGLWNPAHIEADQVAMANQWWEAQVKKLGFKNVAEHFDYMLDLWQRQKNLTFDEIKRIANTNWPMKINTDPSMIMGAQSQMRRLIHEAELLNFDPKMYASLTRNLENAVSVYGQSKLNYRYTYFTEGILKEMEHLKTMMKTQPHLIDKAGVLSALDSAVSSIQKGHPEWLRHSLRQLRKAVSGKSELVADQSRLSVYLDMLGNAEDRIKSHTAELLSQAARSGALSKRLPRLRLESDVADRAIDTANRFYGSYNSLTPFEKQIVRRIVPFYTFTKAMTKLAFQFPYLYPKRTFIISHLAQAWNDVMHDDNAYMPSWAKNYIPVAGTHDGGVVMVRIGSFTPLANIRMGSFGEHETPGIMDIASQHPVIKLMFDLKGGIPDWSKRPMSPGESAVRLDNGEVVKWNGTGFQTEIAQPGILKSVFGMFPQAQLIHSVISPYAQTDRGWLFHPDPILDPLGKPRYPKELSDILLSFVTPTTTVNTDELKRQEMVRVASVVKEFQREARTAPPERRQALVEALRAWAVNRRQAVER